MEPFLKEKTKTNLSLPNINFPLLGSSLDFLTISVQNPTNSIIFKMAECHFIKFGLFMTSSLPNMPNYSDNNNYNDNKTQ